MQCPKCGCEDVTVQFVEKGQKTKRKGLGFGGHANNMARGVTAVCTVGLSNLFWKKSEGVNKTETLTEKVAICQGCGHSWEV